MLVICAISLTGASMAGPASLLNTRLGIVGAVGYLENRSGVDWHAGIAVDGRAIGHGDRHRLSLPGAAVSNVPALQDDAGLVGTIADVGDLRHVVGRPRDRSSQIAGKNAVG